MIELTVGCPANMAAQVIDVLDAEPYTGGFVEHKQPGWTTGYAVSFHVRAPDEASARQAVHAALAEAFSGGLDTELYPFDSYDPQLVE